jgi:hypothetical protein
MAKAPIFKMRQPVFFLGLSALFYALFLILSCESVEIAGGASEIGNPKTIASDQDEESENKGKVVGVQIGVSGPAIVVIHRKKPSSNDSLTQSQDSGADPSAVTSNQQDSVVSDSAVSETPSTP